MIISINEIKEISKEELALITNNRKAATEEVNYILNKFETQEDQLIQAELESEKAKIQYQESYKKYITIKNNLYKTVRDILEEKE